MKKVKYLAMLLAAGMFAACSDNLEDTGAGNAGGTTPSTTEGYVRVAINMPTTSGGTTRSVTMSDGTTDEYAVKNAILAFFKTTTTTGSGETKAQFVKAYDVTLSPAGNGNSEVTTRYTVVQEVPMTGTEEDMYVLAILNKNALFSVENTTGDLQQNGTDVLTAGGSNTLSDLQKTITTTADACTADGFLMLNAPLAKTATATGLTLANVQTLVPVTVYENQTTAENNDAASIYVERIVAKVTLTGFDYDKENDKYTKTVTAKENDPFYQDQVEFTGWTLSVTNNTTKAVRDVEDIATWVGNDYGIVNRFLGTTNIDAKNLYRIYWGKDCNYATNDDYSNAFTTLTNSNLSTWTWNTNTADNTKDTNEDYALYCLENTMDFKQQNQDQTTTLVLRTQYIANPNETGDNTQHFFMFGTGSQTYTTTQFLEQVKTTLSLGSDITISLADNATGGTYTYIPDGQDNQSSYVGKKDIKTLFTLSGNTTSLTDIQAQALINALGEIKFYEHGVSYYNTVLIRHFDDLETPWNVASSTYTGAHLGRYGVLRNNWYEIKIDEISGPGNPDIDEPEGPDDGREGYIRAEINVLSWAKRTQDVDL